MPHHHHTDTGCGACRGPCPVVAKDPTCSQASRLPGRCLPSRPDRTHEPAVPAPVRPGMLLESGGCDVNKKAPQQGPYSCTARHSFQSRMVVVGPINLLHAPFTHPPHTHARTHPATLACAPHRLSVWFCTRGQASQHLTSHDSTHCTRRNTHTHMHSMCPSRSDTPL